MCKITFIYTRRQNFSVLKHSKLSKANRHGRSPICPYQEILFLGDNAILPFGKQDMIANRIISKYFSQCHLMFFGLVLIKPFFFSQYWAKLKLANLRND